MIPPRIELGTFCVLGRCDNRYTTESYASLARRSASPWPQLRSLRVRGQNSATAGNRTRINCLEGNYANHYTTVATYPSRTPSAPVLRTCTSGPSVATQVGTNSHDAHVSNGLPAIE